MILLLTGAEPLPSDGIFSVTSSHVMVFALFSQMFIFYQLWNRNIYLYEYQIKNRQQNRILMSKPLRHCLHSFTPARRSRVRVSAVYSAHCTVQLTLTWARPPLTLRSITSEHITRLTKQIFYFLF